MSELKYRLHRPSQNQTSKKEYPPSKTVPDQAMSIKELIARNQRGLPLSGKQPIYGVSESDPEVDQFSIAVNKMGHLDLAEREALQDQLEAQIFHLKAKAVEIDKRTREAQEKALIAADEEKFKQYAERLAKLAKTEKEANAS